MFFKQGRQGYGYLKLKFISFWFFDLYLLKYPTGSAIQPHRDPVPGKRHYRLNWTVWRADQGGNFWVEVTRVQEDRLAYWNGGRVVLFRPDVQEHSVTKIEKGTRWVLSLGWVRPTLPDQIPAGS